MFVLFYSFKMTYSNSLQTWRCWFMVPSICILLYTIKTWRCLVRLSSAALIFIRNVVFYIFSILDVVIGLCIREIGSLVCFIKRWDKVISHPNLKPSQKYNFKKWSNIFYWYPYGAIPASITNRLRAGKLSYRVSIPGGLKRIFSSQCTNTLWDPPNRIPSGRRKCRNSM
jgi:hypothetical protein